MRFLFSLSLRWYVYFFPGTVPEARNAPICMHFRLTGILIPEAKPLRACLLLCLISERKWNYLEPFSQPFQRAFFPDRSLPCPRLFLPPGCRASYVSGSVPLLTASGGRGFGPRFCLNISHAATAAAAWNLDPDFSHSQLSPGPAPFGVESVPSPFSACTLSPGPCLRELWPLFF